MLRIFTHSISQSGSINTFVSTWTLWAVVGRVICAAARKTRRKTFQRVQLSDSINVARSLAPFFRIIRPMLMKLVNFLSGRVMIESRPRVKKSYWRSSSAFVSHLIFLSISTFTPSSYLFFSSCFLRPLSMLGCVERPNWCWWDQFKRN